MKETVRVTLTHNDPMMYSNFSFGQLGCSKEQAIFDNIAFDNLIKDFLRSWLDQSPVLLLTDLIDDDTTLDDFIEQNALRSFFRYNEDALEQLLEQPAVARHLLRPVSNVHFLNDAYEPLFSQFEQRIYNLAAQQEHHQVSFRYSSLSRQNAYADTIALSQLPPDQFREDIGVYFGTRRSDEVALTLLGRQLRREAFPASSLPVHVITEGYMEDSLRVVKRITEHIREEEATKRHCFIIQRRHAADDRHLGAALLIMNPAQPNKPERILFCDTLNPSGTPPWWHSFKRKIDAIFPQPEGEAFVSDILEDGGVKLQRLHDGVPVRHQDIDCAFYTASIGRALVQLAQANPDLILTGAIKDIVSQMTALMPEYYEGANQTREPEYVREVNIIRRWNTGRDAMNTLLLSRLAETPLHQPYVVETALQA
ncbi:hypothetical protein M0L20_15395 [Spirosoma sp. RP8]|uniref:Uncharacterized protein n=1 Tax=Spirosoma liriopis TaxID=2937440 RepID=A0ABT0HM52_9BACT|nr:hypothetical protein [Spirosoma liriopis]MCK8493251.1 hypothetical protein [Spirosoma liriopis]